MPACAQDIQIPNIPQKKRFAALGHDSTTIGMTTEERQQRIAEIEELLSSGVKSHSTDGQVTSFDHGTLRDELRRLKVLEGQVRPRQKVTNIFLG